MILFFIKTNSISANKNSINLSFFVDEHSTTLTNNHLLSSKVFSKMIGFSCKNNSNSIKRNKSLRTLHNHALLFSLEKLILGFDDSNLDEDDEQQVQKKTKTSKRNRSVYLGNIFNPADTFIFDINYLNKAKSNFIYKDGHYLDVIILFHSPPPEYAHFLVA